MLQADIVSASLMGRILFSEILQPNIFGHNMTKGPIETWLYSVIPFSGMTKGPI